MWLEYFSHWNAWNVVQLLFYEYITCLLAWLCAIMFGLLHIGNNNLAQILASKNVLKWGTKKCFGASIHVISGLVFEKKLFFFLNMVFKKIQNMFFSRKHYLWLQGSVPWGAGVWFAICVLHQGPYCIRQRQVRKTTLTIFFFFVFYEGLYFQKNFIWKTLWQSYSEANSNQMKSFATFWYHN